MLSPVVYIRILLFFFLFLFVGSSYKAPVKRPVITSFFGDSREDHFHNGVDYRGFNTPVYPVEDKMKVIFYQNFKDDPTRNLLGYGNFLILEDWNKIRSHYAHLEEIYINNFDQDVVNQDEMIGTMGNSGHSYGGHLHFVMFDLKQDMFVNPLMYVREKQPDKLAPKIVSFFTIINDKVYTFKGNKSSLFYSKPIELYTVVQDPFEIIVDKKKRIAYGGISELKLFIDNKLYNRIDFSLIVENKETHVLGLSKGEKIEDVFGNRYNYKLGVFVNDNSEHQFRIEATDWSNNKSSKEYVVKFR